MPATSPSPQPHGTDPLLEQPEEKTQAVMEHDRKRASTLVESVGYYSISSLVFGSLAILASFSLISFLWFSDSNNETWRRIMINGWATRSVTLASLVIRASVTTQTFVCTAMLAALALRWHQVPLPHAASVSLLRYSNAGPSSLFLPLLGTRLKSFPIAGLLVSILVLTTLSCNITSTALLSDMELGMVPGNKETASVHFGANESRLQFSAREGVISEYWTRRPERFPSFAETLAVPPIIKSDLHDTGVHLRAFLPIASQEVRSNIRNYSGPSTLVAMRTLCVKPRLDVDPQKSFHDRIEGMVYLDLEDDARREFEVFDERRGYPGASFKCKLPQLATVEPTNPEWRAVICWIGNIFKERNSIIKPVYSTAYLLFNVTENNFTLLAEEKPEWSLYRTGREDIHDLTFAATVCVTNAGNKYMSISASRPANITEPVLSWDISRRYWSTYPIRQQLGATRAACSLQERKVLSLDTYGNTTLYPAYFKGEDNVLTQLNNAVPVGWPNDSDSNSNTMGICQDCSRLGSTITLDIALIGIMNDILQDTGRPSLAIHAMAMTLYSMAYYNSLMTFDLEDNTTIIQLFEAALIPVATRGYWAVAAILLCHLGLVLVIVVLYIRVAGPENLLGHAWTAVGQLRSEELDSILGIEQCVTDKDVGLLLKQRGIAKKKVGLAEDENGRVRIKSVKGS